MSRDETTLSTNFDMNVKLETGRVLVNTGSTLIQAANDEEGVE